MEPSFVGWNPPSTTTLGHWAKISCASVKKYKKWKQELRAVTTDSLQHSRRVDRNEQSRRNSGWWSGSGWKLETSIGTLLAEWPTVYLAFIDQPDQRPDQTIKDTKLKSSKLEFSLHLRIIVWDRNIATNVKSQEKDSEINIYFYHRQH